MEEYYVFLAKNKTKTKLKPKKDLQNKHKIGLRNIIYFLFEHTVHQAGDECVGYRNVDIF